MGRTDAGFKNLFSHPEMVADLLRGFVKEEWVSDLDFSTLEKVNTNFITERLRERTNDVIWKIRWGDRDLFVFLMLEFQSSSDPRMSLRMLTYVALLYQDLIKQKKIGAKDRLPPVVPIVLYNGESPWRGELRFHSLVGRIPRGLERFVPNFEYLLIDETASNQASPEEKNLVKALFDLDQTEDLKSLQPIVDHLAVWLQLPKYRSLRRAFAVWIGRGLVKDKRSHDHIEIEDMGDVKHMLSQRVKQWEKKMEAEYIDKGRMEEKRTLARKLLEKGFPVKEVAELTGLTQKEVRRLMEG